MALSQKHRGTIFQRLAPVIGEEEAEALLRQFPSRDLDEPVTKEFVRAEVADVRAEMADLRTEMHQLGIRLFVSLTGVIVGFVSLATGFLHFAS